MFSAIREGRSGSSDETGRRPLRRRRLGALSGAAALGAVVALALPAGALAQTNFLDATNFPLAWTASPRAMAVGDFNGDGDPDLAVTDENGVSVLLGKPGGGSFSEATKATGYPLDSPPQAIAVGHLNKRDGDPVDTYLDLVVTVPEYSQVAVLLGKGDGTFAPARYVEASPWLVSVAVGKIDGDFYPDLAVGSQEDSTVRVLHGKGDGTFGSPASYSADGRPYPHALVLTDFDPRSSKKLDVAVARDLYHGVSVLSDGDGGAPFNQTFGITGFDDPNSIAAGDFDGNGQPDLAVSDSYHGVSVLARGNGWFRSGPFGVGTKPKSVAVGNFNRDSDPDLAVAYYGDLSIPPTAPGGGVSVLLGDSGVNFRRTEKDYAAGAHPQMVATGDFDGDSDSDLAVGNRSNNVSVLLANNAPTSAADAYTTGRDTPLDVGAPGVLGNDKDPDGDKLTLALASPPAHGTVTLNADGSFRYTPDAGGSGSDSFQYTISDGQGGWNVGTVSLTVTAPGGWG
jgi:hypothetical protein